VTGVAGIIGIVLCVLCVLKNQTRPSRLTKKAEPPPTCGVNRDSGTASANGGWLRRLVRPKHRHNSIKSGKSKRSLIPSCRTCSPHKTGAS
jgi:hypothetical protein